MGNFEISLNFKKGGKIMHEVKAGLNAEKFAT